jgi:hypothetical protein
MAFLPIPHSIFFNCGKKIQHKKIVACVDALAKLKRPADKMQENIFWISTSSIESAKTFLQRNQFPVKILAEFPHTNLLVVRTSWRTIDSTLISSPLVRFIDIPRQPKEELALNAFDNSLNKINLVHHRLPSLNGDSLTISVKENIFNASDIDFSGRYLPTPFESAELSPHATIMATIIAGGGNSFYTGRGAAWGATISSSDFASLLPDTAYRRFNISVQNHSYGTDIENYYGADAAAYDATVITDPFLLHIFSAGNAGDRSSASGFYNGITELANLTGSFKMAKNIITVGSVDSFAIVAPLSSKGPAYDGRIKPELVAFGQDGSSGAAATTSGIALLVQQAFQSINNGNLPDAALVKAVLINSADDLGTEGPDYSTGYGNVNAYKAVNSILQQRFFSGNSSTGTTVQFQITVPPSSRRLSLTICWSDPPAAANAARALINDLDLQLENITTLQQWQPWVLSSFPHRDSLLLPARRTRDSLNNVEKITIDDPAPGNYRVSVHGHQVASGPQSWYLGWQIDTADQFNWHYPTASDHLLANEKNIIRWSSTFNNSTTGKLEYSIDKGNSWSVVENAANVASELYNFSTPDIFTLIIFRMTINGQVFISDTSTISKPLNMQVGFNCPDSVLLYWNRANGINNYRIWKLGEKFMEPFASVTDSFLVFGKNNNSSQHYSVAPVPGPLHPGIKAHTIDYTRQGVDCYVKNFLADLLTPGAVLLTFEPGTLHNVKEIVFEKLNGNTFTPIKTLTANSGLIIQYTDSNLRKGSNTYRAAIVLQNGQKIYSQSETVFYFNQSPYLIFPNPVSRNTLLQVHSPDLQPRQLILINSRGQKVKQQTLNNLVSGISLSALPKGAYFILILKEGKKDYSGSLIVQ